MSKSSNDDGMSLSDPVVQIVLGSLLGDGSLKIHRGYANARFSFRHSMAASDYFYWKADRLVEISSDSCRFVQANDGGFSSKEKLRYQSLALPQLTGLFELTSKQGRLSIRRKWLNRLGPLALCVWWLDDGSLVSNTRKGVFCTDGFDQRSVKRLAQYLSIRWSIQTHVAPVGRKRGSTQDQYWRLWIRSTEELKKFLRIILPYVQVESMLYKALILYSDPQLQQRWISEVVGLTNFSEQVVANAILQRKRMLKPYQSD